MPRTSKAATSPKKFTTISLRGTEAPTVLRLRGGGGYQPMQRISKEVEKDRVNQFVSAVAAVKKAQRLQQVWIDLEEFKSAVYGVANGKITDGRLAILDNITAKNNLTYIWSQDKKKIGFVGYSDNDEDLASQVMEKFYDNVARRAS